MSGAADRGLISGVTQGLIRGLRLQIKREIPKVERDPPPSRAGEGRAWLLFHLDSRIRSSPLNVPPMSWVTVRTRPVRVFCLVCEYVYVEGESSAACTPH